MEKFILLKNYIPLNPRQINPTSPDGRDNMKDKAITISYFFIVKLKEHEYIRLFVVTILLE